MSGHSKWATIHRQKGINDSKKGAAFTKISRVITMAVREGGGITDPAMNFKLRLAIEKARQVNMPKDNIQRAIDKGAGVGGEDLMVEAMFEGFGPEGVAIMVSTLTDNKLRSAQAVREILEKNGGVMGSSGSVSYLFSAKGEVRVIGKVSEEQELTLIDAGLDELETDEEYSLLYCDKDKTFDLKEQVEALGLKVDSAELIMKPLALVNVTDSEVRTKIESILERLSDLDDTQKVWTNYA
jgi:YebC/PmpR family DNA-binding regulatory protein